MTITTNTGDVITPRLGIGGTYLCPAIGHVKANRCGVCGRIPSDRCIMLEQLYRGSPDMPICYGCLPEILLLDEVVNG